MKRLAVALAFLQVVWSCRAQTEADLVHRYGRDITKEIRLAEAVAAFNQEYPDPNPLTEDEVIAAIRNWKKDLHPVPDAIHALYLQVAEKRVLPRGMYFKRIAGLRDLPSRHEEQIRNLEILGRRLNDACDNIRAEVPREGLELTNPPQAHVKVSIDSPGMESHLHA